MAIYASPSDQFNSRSNRTMTGRCSSWTRTQQGGNVPIILRTQVDRADKTPVTARRARVGGLCRFRRPAERVPIQQQKTRRCADVRERWRKMLVLARTAVGKAACGKCGKTLKMVKIEGFWTLRRESRTKLRGRARLRSGHNCPPCGQFRGFTRAFQKTQKSAMGCCRMKKARRFKEYSGVPTKDTR